MVWFILAMIIVVITFCLMCYIAIGTHDKRMLKAQEQFRANHTRTEVHHCPIDGRIYAIPTPTEPNIFNQKDDHAKH